VLSLSLSRDVYSLGNTTEQNAPFARKYSECELFAEEKRKKKKR